MPTYARRQIDCSDRRVCGCLDSPSLHGVREGTFPRFLATMKRSDSGPPISPHFVAFTWRYNPCVLFAPSDPTQGRGPWSWYSGSRAGYVGRRGRKRQALQHQQRPVHDTCNQSQPIIAKMFLTPGGFRGLDRIHCYAAEEFRRKSGQVS